MEPKAHCKVCSSYWDVGIVYCTCGHFLRKVTEENQKFVQYTMDLLSIPNYYIKKGRRHGHRYGKKPGDRVLHRQFALEEVQKEVLLGYPRQIHTRRSSARICLTTVEPKKKWDEDHTQNLTPEEIDDYTVNWLIRSNKIGSDTTPIQHRSDFNSNKHCLPCDS